MTADVPTGLVVLHVRLTVQVLAPAAMLHDGDAGVSVPEMVAAVAWVRTKKKKRTEHHPDTKPMLRTSQLRRNTVLETCGPPTERHSAYDCRRQSLQQRGCVPEWV